MWEPLWGGLCWVDMLRGDLLRLDAASADVQRIHVSDVLAAVRPRSNGGVIAAVARGFALSDSVEGPWELLPELWHDTSVRMNEGACDPSGAFWSGSMAYNQRRGAGCLYRLLPDRTVHTMLSGVTVSNGLDWSPDGQHAYYVDSATSEVSRLTVDHESGTAQLLRAFSIPPDLGTPDGLTIDAEGYLWIALWGGAAVHRYRPDGRLDAVVRVPVAAVTACTFGGRHLDELFITTSAQTPEPSTGTPGGSVWHACPGLSGLPARQYLG